MVDKDFESLRRSSVEALKADHAVRDLANSFLVDSSKHKYSYNFDWLGLPVIQYPQDIVAVQELIWKIRPGAVVETGIARGGSLALSASVLQLLGGDGIVVGVDIDIRPPNRAAIEAHPLAHRIRLVEGSSIAEEVVAQVRALVDERRPVIVLLDSMHTHDHVFRELELYSPLVERDSYIVVFDTVIEDMPPQAFDDRPWSTGNNPKTAVRSFLAANPRFVIDDDLEAKLQITVAPSGYLRCIG